MTLTQRQDDSGYVLAAEWRNKAWKAEKEVTGLRDELHAALVQLRKAEEPRRYQCERCGGTGEQPEGSYDTKTKTYTEPAGTCTTCDGEGVLGVIEADVTRYRTSGVADGPAREPDELDGLRAQLRDVEENREAIEAERDAAEKEVARLRSVVTRLREEKYRADYWAQTNAGCGAERQHRASYEADTQRLLFGEAAETAGKEQTQ
jgi:hypothetical protein